MTLPADDTLVNYPSGSVGNAATVLHLERLPDERVAVLLDATSVHPVDAGWPDQGADRAVIRVSSTDIAVEDCIVGATDGATLYLGPDIPVAKGRDGWSFVVVHILESGGGDLLAEGDQVEVVVDAAYRRRMSAGHTACHVASLALNRALANRWRKVPRADALGQPDFDGAAIDVSLIREGGSVDSYRLGKSLRKKGFTTDGLAEALDEVQDAVNASLAAWVKTGAPVRIEKNGQRLTDRRYWVCELPGHEARIPCGGTHLSSLAELGSLRASLSFVDVAGTMVLSMETFAE